MLNLIHAETRKIVGNRLVTGFLLWIYPVASLVFIAFSLVVLLLTNAEPFVTDWRDAMLAVWQIYTKFPGNVLTRLFAGAFCAVTFAGEYEWATWKNIVPRSSRWKLIIAKILALSLILLFTLLITSIVWGVGMWIVSGIAGVSYGPAITGQVIWQFLDEFLLEVILAFVTSLYLAVIAALAVMLTRTVVGGLIVGFSVAMVENLSGQVLLLIAHYFDAPDIATAFFYTPSYSIDNIRSWILDGVNWPNIFAPTYVTVEISLVGSILILSLWLITITAVVLLHFQRQDITV